MKKTVSQVLKEFVCGEVGALFAERLEIGDDESKDEGKVELIFDGVATATDEGGEVEVLFYPLEKEFNVPTLAIDFADFGCCPGEVVGEEDNGVFATLEGGQNNASKAWHGGIEEVSGMKCHIFIGDCLAAQFGGRVGLRIVVTGYSTSEAGRRHTIVCNLMPPFERL